MSGGWGPRHPRSRAEAAAPSWAQNPSQPHHIVGNNLLPWLLQGSGTLQEQCPREDKAHMCPGNSAAARGITDPARAQEQRGSGGRVKQGESWPAPGLPETLTGGNPGAQPHSRGGQTSDCYLPFRPQRHLLHPGHLAGPVLGGFLPASRLPLPQAAGGLCAAQHAWLRPGAPCTPSPGPAGGYGAQRD